MDEIPQRLSRTLWVGVGLLIVILAVAAVLSRVEPKRGRAAAPPVLGQVADFTLTNQSGQAVTLTNLLGQVWVADIIFTSCAGPCPRMTKQMKTLQDALPPASRARLVTLTTDPATDTPAVLKTYAARFGANPDRWLFLTGTKKEIAALAIGSLKLTAIEKKPEERENPQDLFIHSTIFVVVDKQARLRRVFESEGEGIDPKRARDEILATVRQLERER
ncbi:MAG TPA: SCO family protein [Verrucomicrobiae bacterium]|nr:SCO family protein [Verrucomicrobiae bacterium]